MDIYMYRDDHAPPHFHVRYAEYSAQVGLGTREVTQGFLPRRALRLVQDWAELHAPELAENWEIAQAMTGDFKQIEPLR